MCIECVEMCHPGKGSWKMAQVLSGISRRGLPIPFLAAVVLVVSVIALGFVKSNKSLVPPEDQKWISADQAPCGDDSVLTYASAGLGRRCVDRSRLRPENQESETRRVASQPDSDAEPLKPNRYAIPATTSTQFNDVERALDGGPQDSLESSSKRPVKVASQTAKRNTEKKPPKLVQIKL
jgi:hypothetical protein